MGMYSYSCTKCGPKDQFDWMDCCIVKTMKYTSDKEDIYVRGQYDGYGLVKVAVAPAAGGLAPAAAGAGAASTTTCMVIPPSSFQQWEEGQLMATEIYCHGNFTNGGEDADMTNLLHSMAKGQGNFFKALMSAAPRGGNMEDLEDMIDDEEEQIRICVPEGVTVVNALTQEQFTHAAAVSAKAVRARNKRREKKQAADNKNDKKKKKAPTTTPTNAADDGDDDADDNNKKKKAPTTPTKAVGDDGDDNDEAQTKKPKASCTPDGKTTTTTTSSSTAKN